MDHLTDEDRWRTATGVLRLATQLVDGIQDGLAQRGFDDVRPAHGFAFARLSESPATTAQLAAHLGITKQAASQVVQHLEALGYLKRVPDPADGRARLLVLTARGHACTVAARQAATETVASWERELGPGRHEQLRSALGAITAPGPLRPAW